MYFITIFRKTLRIYCVHAQSPQSCPTLFDPWISSTGSFVCGNPQARILECFAVSFSRGSSWPRVWTHHISCIGRWILCHWVTREAPKDPITPPKKIIQSLSRVWLFATPWLSCPKRIIGVFINLLQLWLSTTFLKDLFT